MINLQTRIFKKMTRDRCSVDACKQQAPRLTWFMQLACQACTSTTSPAVSHPLPASTDPLLMQQDVVPIIIPRMQLVAERTETVQAHGVHRCECYVGNHRKLRVSKQPNVTLTLDHVPQHCRRARTILMGPLTPTDLDAAAFVHQQHGTLHSCVTVMLTLQLPSSAHGQLGTGMASLFTARDGS